MRRFALLSLALLSLPALAGSGGPLEATLGLKVGMALEDARAKLRPLGTVGEGKSRGGSVKEGWALKGTDFSAVAYKANAAGKVVWVTGWLRPGKEIPFDSIAAGKPTDEATGVAIWQTETDAGPTRIVAKGKDRKASVVYLILLK